MSSNKVARRVFTFAYKNNFYQNRIFKKYTTFLDCLWTILKKWWKEKEGLLPIHSLQGPHQEFESMGD